ncbi:GNAT family N-acetyltransferase [Streptomyces yaizuensis]|uniref:GNAT family N-acetyltransferase n=1 Tax=Streptomyces yaizuensis TaxID=2989713 RepID=A0ABQ5NZ95_9ACTN|nr:GNAT family N-acetyltransferase [Streptomyces sp. YSPA8]GLF95687.1 GNAT family N-acetyltransferase [Streptomyces sp. YSPA8]
MTQVTSAAPAAPSARRRHPWRRDLVELAAVFTAVAAADAIAKLVARGPDGPALLVLSALALVATAAFHTWWAHRHSHAPPSDTAPTIDSTRTPRTTDSTIPTIPTDSTDSTDSTADADAPPEPGAGEPAPGPEPRDPAQRHGPAGDTTLWRMRTTVRDEPGSLAALCTALAALDVDILALQTHPLADGTVDEFLLRAPAALPPRRLTGKVAAAGGSGTWIERADAHDLVDTPTRVLRLAARTALDAAELPLALRQLLGRCTVHSRPAVSPTGRPAGDLPPVEGSLEGTVMRFRDPRGGSIEVERHHLPFTPAEFARARALLELDARLGPRVPTGQDVLTLPEGNAITIGHADQRDLAAARELHQRCSEETLRRRYHGPVGDADRYLDHLLSPRFGRTLAVRTASGRLVALGHLLWDGDETEIALLVEDAWQRRGIGSELLARLVVLAREAGSRSVYAVTQAANTGMVAAMRGLGLPLDYQVEEGTVVLTATLTSDAGRAGPARGRVER